jgi:membrane protein
MAFLHFRMPIGPWSLTKRVFSEILEDNCLGLAAQLAFYFLLALFPALIFLVALIGLLPIDGVMSTWLAALARFAPPDVLDVVRDQFLEVRRGNQVSLLTVGFAGAVWSSSTAMTAIIGTLNTAYGLQERRPWWKCRFLAIGLTLSLAVFMVLAQALILLAPWAADLAATRTGIALGSIWDPVRWVLAVGLLVTALDVIYHFAPDAESEFTWLTPGALVAALLWFGASYGFKMYVEHVDDFAATYGTLGGVVVVMLWFYLSGLAILVGAEVNAEIDRAAEYGRELTPEAAGGRPRIGIAAERTHAWRDGWLRRFHGQPRV